MGGGGAPATAGSAGARSDAGGTAGASGPGGSAGGAGAPSVSATEICVAAVEAQCQRLIACQGAAAVPDCSRYEALCPGYYFNEDSYRTAAGIASCITALASRTCTDVAIGLFPACFTEGKRPTDAPCAYSSQCVSGSCSTGAACSTCRAGGVPVGGSCSSAACQNGSFCHPTTRVCTDGSTVMHAAEGQPCDLSASPVVGCTGDLVCVPATSDSTAGTCTPPPGIGQPCATVMFSNLVCGPGAKCTAPSGGTCLAAVPCGTSSCDTNSYCKGGDGGMTCAPLAAVGAACGDATTTQLPPCLPPAVCAGAPGRCVRPRAIGDLCDSNNPCAASLTCTNGVCSGLKPTDCPI